MFFSVLNVLLPVFIVMFLGWNAGRKGVVPMEHRSSLVTFVMSYSLPALLFISTSKMEIEFLLNKSILLSFGIGLSVTYIVTFLFYKLVLKHDVKTGSLASLATSLPNLTFMGLPILMSLYGERSLVAVVLSNLIGSFILIPITVGILEPKGVEEKKMSKLIELIKGSLLNPIILAPLLGILVSFIGIPIPNGVEATMNLVGNCASGLSLFTIGLAMSSYKIDISLEVLVLVFIKSIICPVIMFVIAIGMGIKGILLNEIIILSSLPSATITSMFSTKYEIYNTETINATLIGSLVSVFTVGMLIAYF